MFVWLHYCPTRSGNTVGTYTGQSCLFCGATKGNRWLTPTQAGQVLGIHRDKVNVYARSGSLLAEHHSGLWRILRAHVECIRAGWIKLDKD